MTEWVEVKGATVEVAVKAGLAELGIDGEDRASIEILQEPEKGFLGIGRQDAIVRIKHKSKRKRSRGRSTSEGGSRHQDNDGRHRDQRSRGSQERGDGGGQSRRQDRSRGGDDARSQSGRGISGSRDSGARDSSSRDGGQRGQRGQRGGQGGGERTEGRSGNRNRGGNERGRQSRNGGGNEGQRRAEAASVDINEQATVIEEFLSGLLGAFGLDGTATVRVEDDVIYADIEGEQTEALIGTKASILQAIHELAKTVVQRKTMAGARLRLDIGGYAVRRREALTIYAGRLAAQVIEENTEIMLEAMNAADRKTVHDAASNIEGVRSFSEGEDPRRSVVLAPDGD